MHAWAEETLDDVAGSTGPDDSTEQELRLACQSRGLSYVGPGEGSYGKELLHNLSSVRQKARSSRHQALRRLIRDHDQAKKVTCQSPGVGPPAPLDVDGVGSGVCETAASRQLVGQSMTGYG